MIATGSTHEKFRVGDLEIDSGTFTARRQGEEIALPKLSFELLLCLARHAPNVVSTESLMDEVWEQVVVGEETVKQRVKLLRKALGDSSSDRRYIAAVRGRGYRLLAEVSPLADEPGDAADGLHKSRSAKTWLLPMVLLVIIAVGLFVVTQNKAPEDLGSQSTENPQAWEAYQKGRAAYRRWTRQDNETALAFYERATDLDPGFALAIAGAANAQALRATEFGLGEEWIDEAIILPGRPWNWSPSYLKR